MGRSILLLTILIAGCQSSSAHAFYSSDYDAEGQCLSPVELDDVLQGPDPGTCKQTVCWVDTKGHAHLSFTMCDGPPDWTRVDNPPAGSICEAALKALAQWGVGGCAPEAGVEAGE
ncbi:MAG: hypothetical protein HY898_34035 [Deltaproteobacteria bacterium]|nr:hypothetical protein [Deltaproteobacteria bacterium]